MFSCRLKKWNKYSIKQDRNFVITNLNLYNFKQKRKCALKPSTGPASHGVPRCPRRLVSTLSEIFEGHFRQASKIYDSLMLRHASS